MKRRHAIRLGSIHIDALLQQGANGNLISQFDRFYQRDHRGGHAEVEKGGQRHDPPTASVCDAHVQILVDVRVVVYPFVVDNLQMRLNNGSLGR
jgi:hypothetical protein